MVPGTEKRGHRGSDSTPIEKNSECLQIGTLLQNDQNGSNTDHKTINERLRSFADIQEDYMTKGPTQEVLQDIYTFLEPYLKELNLTTLLPTSIDSDLAKLFFTYFKPYFIMLTEVNYDYWKYLKLQPDLREFKEVAKIRAYIGVFRSKWRSVYKNRRKKDAKTFNSRSRARSKNTT